MKHVQLSVLRIRRFSVAGRGNWPMLWTGIHGGLPRSSRMRCSKTGRRATPPATPASIRSQRASGTIIAKQECILAGLGCVPRILDVYAALDGAVTSHYEVTSHPEVFRRHPRARRTEDRGDPHNARVILSCERVILNFLQRLSGIATLTRKFVDAVSGTRAHILDTRKTAPGLRMIDKYAVRCGGGQNHRLDLSDGVLIKNNHIALAGGIVPALERASRNRRGRAADRDRSALTARTGRSSGRTARRRSCWTI